MEGGRLLRNKREEYGILGTRVSREERDNDLRDGDD